MSNLYYDYLESLEPKKVIHGSKKVCSDLRVIGQTCKKYRESIGLYQSHVAEDTGYTTENISAFETGRNDNSRILLWYMKKGMTIDYMLEVE